MYVSLIYLDAILPLTITPNLANDAYPYMILTLNLIIHTYLPIYLMCFSLIEETIAMGGTMVRKEPTNTKFLLKYPNARTIFMHACWLSFLERFQGSDFSIPREFS